MISRDAISKIRELSKKRMPASYAYVIDDENHLAGVLNMRDLMIAPGHQPLEAIMLKKAFLLILKEGKLGAINGIIIGIITAAIAWVWKGSPFLGIVIGLGMLVNLTCAGLSGAAIPLVMKRVGIDPAQSSSIILTTVTDVVGFFAFLGFAVLLQNYMDLLQIGTWIGILICLSQSAMFSGMNLAAFSISRLRLEVQASSGNKLANKVLDLREVIKMHMISAEAEKDVILLWGEERRVITGADILGRLMRGIIQSSMV